MSPLSPVFIGPISPLLHTWVNVWPRAARQLQCSAFRGESLTLRHTIDFTLHPDARAYDKHEKTVLYQRNPAPNWGPGSRAKNSSSTKAEDGPAEGGEKRKLEVSEGSGADPKKAKVDGRSEVEVAEEDAMNV
jgi:hypothetical protein